MLSIMLFSKEERRCTFSFKNLHTCGYYIPPHIEIWRCSYYSTIIGRMLCNKHICPLVILIPRIFLVSDSTDIQSHIDSETTFSAVSSIIYSLIIVC